MLIAYAAATIAIVWACWRLLAALFNFWEQRASEYRPPGSALDALMRMLAAVVARARAFMLAPLPAGLAVMAAWAMFLLAPGTARADYDATVLASPGPAMPVHAPGKTTSDPAPANASLPGSPVFAAKLHQKKSSKK